MTCAARFGRPVLTDVSVSAPVLQVQGVTLQYKTEKHLVTATYRVSFDVFGGDRFVLLGPSGCGKSTLLKAIGGYMAATEVRSHSTASRSAAPGPIASSCSRNSTSCCRGRP